MYRPEKRRELRDANFDLVELGQVYARVQDEQYVFQIGSLAWMPQFKQFALLGETPTGEPSLHGIPVMLVFVDGDDASAKEVAPDLYKVALAL